MSLPMFNPNGNTAGEPLCFFKSAKGTPDTTSGKNQTTSVAGPAHCDSTPVSGGSNSKRIALERAFTAALLHQLPAGWARPAASDSGGQCVRRASCPHKKQKKSKQQPKKHTSPATWPCYPPRGINQSLEPLS